jgi:Trypsin-like peptidase domain
MGHDMRSVCAILIFLSCFVPLRLEAQTCKSPEAVTAFGTWVSPNIELNSKKRFAPIPLQVDGLEVSSARLLFRVITVADNDWSLVVRDGHNRPLAAFTSNDFIGGATRWTARLPGSEFKAELYADSSIETLRILVTDAVALPAQTEGNVHYFSVQNDDNPTWTELYSGPPSVAQRIGDAVGMVYSVKEIVSSGTRASWCCSGVMISRDLFLTNWHCGGVAGSGEYWDGITCGNTLVDLSWDGGKTSRQFSCEKVPVKSEALDYAVLRLKPVIGSGARSEGFGFPRISSAAVTKEGLQIIHHAKCSPKLLSTNCSVSALKFRSWLSGKQSDADKEVLADAEITHTCDTEPGASGAPVFDLGGKLIALHHLGFARDEQCKPTDRVNKAVELRHILSDIKLKSLDVFNEIQDRVD